MVKAGSYAESPDDPDAAYAYTSTTRNGHASSALIASGLENGTEYYVSFFPVTSDGAVNANDVNRGTGTPNRFIVWTAPYPTYLTYNGSEQTAEFPDYDPEKMTIGGTTSATNAGDYTATFTLKEDYQWGDGTTEAKEVTWSINKAFMTGIVSTTSLSLSYGSETKTITVTRPGNGAVSASSSDESCATVSVSDPTGESPTVTVTGKGFGKCKIDFSVVLDDNYYGFHIDSVSVVSEVADAVLNNNSWDTISKISAKNQGANYWSVGDCKSVLVKGTVGTLDINQTLWVYILGFNHNSAIEGNGITFGCFKTAQSGGVDVALVDSKYDKGYDDSSKNGTKYFTMNHWGNFNMGGWKACDLRYDILGSTNEAPINYGASKSTSNIGYDAPENTATSPVANTLMAALPADLRAVMKPITKYSNNYGCRSDIEEHVTTSIDYLPLLTEHEIFGGERVNANQYERKYQAQYTYYAAGNRKIKCGHNLLSTDVIWWCRSPIYGNNNSLFICVSEKGNSDTGLAFYSLGLSPIFLV